MHPPPVVPPTSESHPQETTFSPSRAKFLKPVGFKSIGLALLPEVMPVSVVAVRPLSPTVHDSDVAKVPVSLKPNGDLTTLRYGTTLETFFNGQSCFCLISIFPCLLCSLRWLSPAGRDLVEQLVAYDLTKQVTAVQALEAPYIEDASMSCRHRISWLGTYILSCIQISMVTVTLS